MPGERGACQQRAVLKPSVALVANTGAVAAADRECCFGIGTSIRGFGQLSAVGSTSPDAVSAKEAMSGVSAAEPMLRSQR
jgi:hypothetical protein